MTVVRTVPSFARHTYWIWWTGVRSESKLCVWNRCDLGRHGEIQVKPRTSTCLRCPHVWTTAKGEWPSLAKCGPDFQLLPLFFMAIYFYPFFVKQKTWQNHRKSKSCRIRFKAVNGLTRWLELCIRIGVATPSKTNGSHASTMWWTYHGISKTSGTYIWD